MSDKQQFPFIEAIDDNEWDIKEGSPDTSLINKKMYVPLGDAPHLHSTRMRELGRVKWMPENTDISGSVSKDCLAAVEDARINLNLVGSGVKVCDLLPRKINKDMLNYYLKMGDPRNAALLIIKNIGTPVISSLIGHIDNIADKTTDEKLKQLTTLILEAYNYTAVSMRPFMPWNNVVYIAKHLENILSRKIYDKEDDDMLSCTGPSTSKRFISLVMDKGLSELLENSHCGRETNEWGRLKIDKCPMLESIREKHINRTKYCNEEGVFLRQPWRFHTDHKIFSAVRKRHGGSVLIDCSGSMCLSSDSIKEIVDLAPAVTVALYSGREDSGVLREIVRGERKVADSLIEAPSGQSNVVDGPCIKGWLSKQPQPRIWVSDGAVTGVGDKQAINLTDEVIQLCRKYFIIRVDDVERAKILFRNIKTNGFQQHPAVKLRNSRS